jgi:hypothetical protein
VEVSKKTRRSTAQFKLEISNKNRGGGVFKIWHTFGDPAP